MRSVHTIDIRVADADWEQLKKDALSKECIDSTVLIDGETVHHVGVRTKGNSTLLFNAAKGWDRFSLVLEFDAFQESQRYHGLDCVSLYNNMFDASTMKTYLCCTPSRASILRPRSATTENTWHDHRRTRLCVSAHGCGIFPAKSKQRTDCDSSLL